MYNYRYNAMEGCEVIAENAYETFRLVFDSEEQAQSWEQRLNKQLRSLENMFCLSCLSYNATVLDQNTEISVLTDSRNSNNSKDFLQPVFVCDMATKGKQSLLDGWEACMLNDSRVYYFNREKWLSSWCIPKEDFDADAPYGWQKYYDNRGIPFYYNAKTKQTSEDRPLMRVERARGCPACGYELSLEDIRAGICPGCNTNIRL